MRVGSAPSCLLSEPHKISLTHKSSSAAAAASFRMTDAKGRKLVGWLVHRAAAHAATRKRAWSEEEEEDVCFSRRARGESQPTLNPWNWAKWN